MTIVLALNFIVPRLKCCTYLQFWGNIDMFAPGALDTKHVYIHKLIWLVCVWTHRQYTFTTQYISSTLVWVYTWTFSYQFFFDIHTSMCTLPMLILTILIINLPKMHNLWNLSIIILMLTEPILVLVTPIKDHHANPIYMQFVVFIFIVWMCKQNLEIDWQAPVSLYCWDVLFICQFRQNGLSEG